MNKPLALIIEDDPQLGMIFSLTLQKEFETEIITNGQAAIDRLAEIMPVLVVLDANLPQVGGIGVLKHIRSDPRLVNTKVIIATADSNQYAILAEGADIAILKPVSPIQLREFATRLRNA